MNPSSFDNTTLTAGKRQTNMEILRILAMFLVLAVHANFYSLGTPTAETIANSPIGSLTRIVLCVMCCMCVNLFILISGWFSIKPSLRGFSKFVFQCLYFSVGIYVVMLLTGNAQLSILDISRCFYFTDWDWFVKAYIGLYVIAPALNALVEKTTKKQLQYFLLTFYLFQTLYSIRGSASFIESGYSTFSFIGLYMIGRYLSKYGLPAVSNKQLVAAVCFPILLTSTVYFLDASKDTFMFSGMCLSYANPIMIIAAAALTLLFGRLKIKYIPVINFISASAFAAYLFHYDPHILLDYFCKISQRIYADFSGLGCLGVELLFIVVVFIISVILDQPRKYLWNKINQLFFLRKTVAQPKLAEA